MEYSCLKRFVVDNPHLKKCSHAAANNSRNIHNIQAHFQNKRTSFELFFLYVFSFSVISLTGNLQPVSNLFYVYFVFLSPNEVLLIFYLYFPWWVMLFAFYHPIWTVKPKSGKTAEFITSLKEVYQNPNMSFSILNGILPN